MEKKKIFSLAVAMCAVLTLSACGGAAESTSQGGQSSAPSGESQTSQEGSQPAPSSQESSINPEELDDMFKIEGLENDLEIDDGEVLFNDEVNITLWSVINAPDDVAMQSLVSQFNSSYAGEIHINMLQYSVDDYYNALDTAWNYTPDSIPDVTLMHCEKIVSYAYKDYLYPLNDIIEATGIDFDFDQIYDNVDRANLINYGGKEYRYSIPMDIHTFLFSIRQDMIKKNNLGFENNTRFYPTNRAEFQQLMQAARAKADAGELYYRFVDKANWNTMTRPHEWKLLPAASAKTQFYPAFMPIQDVTGLSGLYSNGGRLVNEAGDTIVVEDCDGFKDFLNDNITYYNEGLIRFPTISEQRTNQSMFGAGETLMFEQGPWWVGQQYRFLYNNEEMTTSNYQGHDTGITPEDAADPIYSSPMIAMNPAGWFSTTENPDSGRVYGNGHSIGITKKVTSMTKAAAILTFVKWLCQEKTSGAYNLTEHCLTGHLPAWKNVFEDEDYSTKAATSLVLQALGDPANMITMENLKYEEVCVSAASKVMDAVYSNLMSDDESLKTYDVALDELEAVCISVQQALDLKIENED